MVAALPTLIDKQDAFEVVRDQIAVILATNQASQQVLAVGAGKDPAAWELRIFAERSNPWEQFVNSTDDTAPNLSPIVNVWYESGTFDRSKGDAVRRQAHAGVFNIDVYGHAITSGTAGVTGQTPGDEGASLAAQRATRLVRNILMASENTYLQLRGTVWSRWVENVTSFQPEIQNESATKIVGIRIALRVEFNEFSPQAEGETLEFVSVDINRDSDGMLIAEADYDLTP